MKNMVKERGVEKNYTPEPKVTPTEKTFSRTPGGL